MFYWKIEWVFHWKDWRWLKIYGQFTRFQKDEGNDLIKLKIFSILNRNHNFHNLESSGNHIIWKVSGLMELKIRIITIDVWTLPFRPIHQDKSNKHV